MFASTTAPPWRIAPLTDNDYGTAERAQHGPLIKTARSQTEGGIVTGYGLQAEYPSLLHELYDLGRLRSPGEHPDLAKPRIEVGEWLQRCFVRAGLSPKVVINFETHGFAVDTADDAVSWNHAAYRDAMRAMGVKYASVVEQVCQAEHFVNNPRPCDVLSNPQYQILRDGLDVLAKHRGVI